MPSPCTPHLLVDYTWYDLRQTRRPWFRYHSLPSGALSRQDTRRSRSQASHAGRDPLAAARRRPGSHELEARQNRSLNALQHEIKIAECFCKAFSQGFWGTYGMSLVVLAGRCGDRLRQKGPLRDRVASQMECSTARHVEELKCHKLCV